MDFLSFSPWSFSPKNSPPTSAEKTLGNSRRVMLTLRSSCASFLTALDKPGRVKGVGWMDGRMDGCFWYDHYLCIIEWGLPLMGVISHWWMEDAKMLHTGVNTGFNESLVVRT